MTTTYTHLYELDPLLYTKEEGLANFVKAINFNVDITQL